MRILYAVETYKCRDTQLQMKTSKNYIHLLKNLSQSTSSKDYFLVSRGLGTGAISKMLQIEMRPRSAAQPRENNVLKLWSTQLPGSFPVSPGATGSGRVIQLEKDNVRTGNS